MSSVDGRFVRGAALFAGLLLAVGVLVTSCASSEQNRELTVGNINWDESIAVSNLTKVLLEEEIGYENVELRTLDVEQLFEGVGSGDLDAFQDVWLPNHREYLNPVEDDVVLLAPWFQGQTSFGIAVPSYVNIQTISQLNQTNIREILGIEPGAVISRRIPESVIPTYDLEQDYVESSSTAGMLAEVEDRYNNGEDFSFIAWSPHWMNQRYDYTLLDDPEDALGDLNDGAEIAMVVNEDLPDDDPVAYAFMEALTLTEEQVNDLEDTINEAGDPLEGARQWTQDNRDVVEPWLEAARNAQES
jgi:glycine betaine/proline transport system substrate-binding protein